MISGFVHRSFVTSSEMLQSLSKSLLTWRTQPERHSAEIDNRHILVISSRTGITSADQLSPLIWRHSDCFLYNNSSDWNFHRGAIHRVPCHHPLSLHLQRELEHE